MGLARLTICVMAILGAGMTLGFQIYAAGSFTDDLFSLVMAGWGAGPFLLLGLSSFFLPRGGLGRGILATASAFLVGVSGYILWEAFVVILDPQSGLIFLFLPFYQIIFIVIFYGFARFLGSRRNPASN